MHHEQSQELYVSIREPIEIRRNLLESSKDIIETLKRFQNISGLKDKKLNEINNLKSDVRDINRLLSKLRGGLPKTKLKFEAVQETEKQKGHEKKAQTESKAEKPKKELTEIEKLEKELEEIESKLNEIS